MGYQMKSKLKTENYLGAIAVLENYLDGAIADYENGDVENDSLIQDSIETIKLIYALTNPILLYSVKEYEERMKKAKELKNNKIV